jgi:uroporphyrinogen decarboxylase
MKEMTSKERFTRMFEHKEADRVPIIDGPWGTTIARWRREGLPENVSYVDYFGLDHTAGIGVDNSPRFEPKTIEETDEYRIYTTKWGATRRSWKHVTSTPEHISYRIVDRDSWEKAKERIQPTRDRVNWDHLKNNYKSWREKGYWINAGLTFGYDITHANIVGMERLLIAMLEEPEWCMDLFSYLLEVNLALLDMVWDAGYHFDGIHWCDDMGYKGTQFFSLKVYREVLKPYHKRAIDWAHEKGIKAHLHSCGNINTFVPELVEIGLDALNPLEVKAGMNPIYLKKTYGKNLVFKGGINAVLWDKPDEIKAEMEKVLPVMKESGGYIFSSDHSIPDSVSFQDFTQIVELAKKLGSYN